MKIHRGITMIGLSGTRRGFTLIELLVVIAIISLLVSILIPSLQKAKEIAYGVSCLSNLHAIGLGIGLYANENNDAVLPYKMYCTRDEMNAVGIETSYSYDCWWPRALHVKTMVDAVSDGDFSRDSVFRCPGRMHEKVSDNNKRTSYAMNRAANTLLGSDMKTTSWQPDYPGTFSRAETPSETFYIADGGPFPHATLDAWDWVMYPTFSSAGTHIMDTGRHMGYASVLFVDMHAAYDNSDNEITSGSSPLYRTSWFFYEGQY